MMLRTSTLAAGRRLTRAVAAPRHAPVAARALSQHAPEDATLWARMGGEPVIRPMVAGIYKLHATDPLSAPWFGAGKFGNTGNDAHVIERVFTFFSAGIGGPHKYEGADMIPVHRGMKINEPAFHAVAYHVLIKMQEHGAGGHREREEVLAILMSLKEQVFAKTNEDVPASKAFIPHDAKKASSPATQR
jgi:hemoglobin